MGGITKQQKTSRRGKQDDSVSNKKQKEMEELDASLQNKIHELEEGQEDTDKLKKQVMDYHKENVGLMNIAKTQVDDKAISESDTYMLANLVKRYIYPKCQYVNNDVTLNMIMKKLYKLGDFRNIHYKDMKLLFRDHVLKTINHLRNATVQKMKTAYVGTFRSSNY